MHEGLKVGETADPESRRIYFQTHFQNNWD